MNAKYIVLAAALIVVTPIFTAAGATLGASGISSSGGAGSGPSHSSGGGGSGGGGHMGGSGFSAGGGHGGALGGRGAANSARGATLANHGAQRMEAHAGRAADGRRAAESRRVAMESSSKTPGMHHHQHVRREPPIRDAQYLLHHYHTCLDAIDPFRPWSDCLGPTKSGVRGAG